MPQSDSNAKPKQKSVLSVGSLFMLTAVVALLIANFGLEPKLTSITEEVRQLRFDAAALHVADRSKIVVVGKPRIRFDDLIYEVHIPFNGSFVICGSGGREAQKHSTDPRVMAPLPPGSHTIEFVARFNAHGRQFSTALDLEIYLDGNPSILLPIQLDQYQIAAGSAANPSLNATLRYLSYTSFEVDEKAILLDTSPNEIRLEKLQFWIQQSEPK
jgi:hypothetical protein